MDANTWERLETVFFAALDLAPHDRPAFLVEACGGDAELEAEVAAMLVAHEEPEDTGLEIERALLNEERHPALPEDTAREGMLAGAWRLERPLGRGGMGEVWLASRASGDFDQRAAVKLVRSGWRSAELAQRFRRERQLLARLTHPNIATLLDGGLTAAGLPYLVMEYVAGEPITTWCTNRALPRRERLALFREVCEAVRFAHANLVVHRDLKPANILVTKDGRPVLLDFGIAKLLDPEDPGGAATRIDERLLTPEHAAPEQLRGDAATIATDVWALGALLFEMLTERRPFDVKGKTSSSIERIVCETDPPRPSAVAAAADAKALRGDLDAIVLNALRREPERRYRSVEQLTEDVERYLHGLPVRAQADTFGYRARKFAGRHRAALVSASAFVLLLVAATVSWWHQARVVSRERDRAVSANRDSEQAIAMLVDLFSVANPRVTPGGDSLHVGDMLRLMTEQLGASTESPRVRAKLWSSIAEIHTTRGAYAEAESAAVRGIAAAADGGLEAEHLLLSHQRARIVGYRDGRDAAVPRFRESLQRHEAFYGNDHPELIPVLLDVATVTEDREEAGALLDRAIAIATARRDSTQLAAIHNVRGANHYAARRFSEASESFRQAYEALVAKGGASDADLLVVRNNLAVCESAAGRYAAAERSHRDILERRRRVFGDRSLEVGASWSQLGVTLAAEGRYDEAVAALRTAAGVISSIVGPEHPDALLARRSLGAALVWAGKTDEGYAAFDSVVAGYRNRFGEGSPELLYASIGRLELDLIGGRAASLAAARDRLAEAQAFDPPASEAEAQRLLGLSALVFPGEARPGEAKGALAAALAAGEAKHPQDHPEVQFLRAALAAARHDAGETVDPDSLSASLRGCASWGLAPPRVLRRARAVLAEIQGTSARS